MFTTMRVQVRFQKQDSMTGRVQLLAALTSYHAQRNTVPPRSHQLLGSFFIPDAPRLSAVEGRAAAGDLHSARLGWGRANRCLGKGHATTLKSSRATLHTLANHEFEAGCAAGEEVVDRLLQETTFLDQVKLVHRSYGQKRELSHLQRCWEGAATAPEEWRACCSNALGDRGLASCFSGPLEGLSFESCCALGGGSDSYLVIPALMEVSVMLLLPNRRLLRIEQDGFLRAFDQSTVLWPAAYLLSQWLASPDRCSQLRGRKVLELGAGVGAPAVAAAACGAKVLATDEALRSLALIQANAGLNGEELDTE
ncbi:unnamed protein product, partial [Polarella glacialis]